MSQLPERLQVSFPQPNLHFLVPKFHLASHLSACQSMFSFNYKRHVGRTDGEGVEHIWSWLNGIAPSTRELGPGGRSDMIDDFIGHHNWMKTIGVGTYTD
jgi:hypothetical protein